MRYDASALTADESIVPIVIIGGGVGGLTAAVYAAQSSIPCLVIEGPKPGGALSQSHSVRNWPGTFDAPGKDIVDSIRDQAIKRGVSIIQESVTRIDVNKWPRIIEVEDLKNPAVKRTIRALAVIIATGSEPNMLPISREYWGKGVSNCAVCDGGLYKNKNVIVVGGGDAAVLEANYLAEIADKVIVVVRRDVFRCNDKQALASMLGRNNVAVLFNTEVHAIEGDGSKITHVSLRNNKTGQEQKQSADGVFLAIGSHPNSDLFKEQLACDDHGYIMLKKYQETSVDGVFAAGNVCNPDYAQAVIAAGDGCKAALQALKFLRDAKFVHTKQVAEQNKDTHGNSGDIGNDSDETHKESTSVARVAEIYTEKDVDALVYRSDRPVVVDMFSTLCIPCQKMAPIVAQSAQEFNGRVAFVKLNVANKSVSLKKMLDQLGGVSVNAVPTFLLVANGHEVGRIVGLQSPDAFKKTIKEIFKIK